jgi:hypothetical protein
MYTFVNLTNHLGEYMLPTPGKLLMKVMYDTFSMIPNYKESGVFSLESLLTMAKKSYKGTNLDAMRSRMYKDVFPCPISFATNVRPFANPRYEGLPKGLPRRDCTSSDGWTL